MAKSKKTILSATEAVAIKNIFGDNAAFISEKVKTAKIVPVDAKRSVYAYCVGIGVTQNSDIFCSNMFGPAVVAKNRGVFREMPADVDFPKLWEVMLGSDFAAHKLNQMDKQKVKQSKKEYKYYQAMKRQLDDALTELSVSGKTSVTLDDAVGKQQAKLLKEKSVNWNMYTSLVNKKERSLKQAKQKETVKKAQKQQALQDHLKEQERQRKLRQMVTKPKAPQKVESKTTSSANSKSDVSISK